MDALHLVDVDTTSRPALRAWNSTLRDGYTTGREAAWWASPEAVFAQYENPRPDRTFVLLLAKVGEVIVGAAEATVDPGEVADVELCVLPAHRRHGIGSALFDGVSRRLADHAERLQAEVYSPEGVAFAQRQGMELGMQEHRLLLDLPVDPEALAAQKAIAQQKAASAPAAEGITVRTWTGACPEEFVEDWTLLTGQMEADVPMGDLTRSPKRSDVAEVRLNEQRMAEQGWVLVSALAQLDGVSVGYSQIFVSRHDPEIIAQDDTLVDRAHRGRGIGRALKIANLENLSGVPEAHDGRWLQTYTALDNGPMLALNRAFGFREADVLSILEGPIASAD